jgi:hypothetical protein
MTIAFLSALVLVSFGAVLFGHGLVRWAARRATGIELVPTFAVGLGTIVAGLALQAGDGTMAVAAQLAALALVVSGILVLVRRRSRSLS